MSTLTFSLAYIALGSVVVFAYWVITAPKHTQFLSLQVRITSIIQIAVNLCHVFSGLFFPLALPLDIPMRSLGLTIFTVGVIFAIWGKNTMKENWGLPGVHKIESQTKLVTNGAFVYSRNPIYTGLILISLGIAIALKSTLIFFVFVLYMYFTKKIELEESSLEKHFGHEFLKYKQLVGRFM